MRLVYKSERLSKAFVIFWQCKLQFNSLRCFSRCREGDESHWTMKSFVTFQVLLECYYVFRATWSSLNVQGSWTVWLLFYNHRCLHLSHNKCFWLILRRYDTVRTRTVHELDDVHIHQYYFQIAYEMKQFTMCQRTNYHYTTNCSGYLSQLELLRDIRTANKHIPKSGKTFDLAFYNSQNLFMIGY